MSGRPAAAALGGAYTDEHHQEFMERGFIHLGQLLPPAELGALSERLDEVMLGSVSYEGVTFQLDPGGAYTRSDMGPWEGASTEYRRIEGLECDPLVAAFSQHPLVTQIHARYYGDTVRARRPIMMNKPAGRSTPLPWHQDVPTGPRCLPPGTPIVNIWTAIDDADEETGCMLMVPGSHKHGILNAGSFTSDANVAKFCTPDAVVPVPVKAGHSVMFNNLTLHSSGVNSSAGRNRRAMVIRPLFDMTR